MLAWYPSYFPDTLLTPSYVLCLTVWDHKFAIGKLDLINVFFIIVLSYKSLVSETWYWPKTFLFIWNSSEINPIWGSYDENTWTCKFKAWKIYFFIIWAGRSPPHHPAQSGGGRSPPQKIVGGTRPPRPPRSLRPWAGFARGSLLGRSHPRVGQ